MSVDSTDSIKEYTPENRHQKKQKNKLSKTWLADTKKILRRCVVKNCTQGRVSVVELFAVVCGISSKFCHSYEQDFK